MRVVMDADCFIKLTEQYRAGRRTLRDVAHRLDLSLSDTLEMFQRLGITGNTGADDTLASFRSTSKPTGRM